ncbi:MAG: ComEA family DNA-binding protein [Legionellales bacterium]
MNARFLALFLSLCVVNLPVQAHASTKQVPETQAVSVTHKIDINTADVVALTGSFKGIGKKRAEAIVAYRVEHKGIKSLDELAEVKGFSQHFVDTNREKLKAVFEVN